MMHEKLRNSLAVFSDTVVDFFIRIRIVLLMIVCMAFGPKVANYFAGIGIS